MHNICNFFSRHDLEAGKAGSVGGVVSGYPENNSAVPAGSAEGAADGD